MSEEQPTIAKRSEDAPHGSTAAESGARTMQEGNQTARWSSPPHFTDNNATFGGPLGILTPSSVGEGRGVSIFTTPAIAPVILTRLVEDAVPTDLAGLKYSALPSTSDAKGNLVLASRAFTRGEVVATEQPLIVGLAEQELSWPQREELLKVAVDQLPKKSQSLVTSLRSDRFQEEGLVLAGIMATNAGCFVAVEGMPHYALYPKTMALVNHDCGPR
jgi:hypothetical protein